MINALKYFYERVSEYYNRYLITSPSEHELADVHVRWHLLAPVLTKPKLRDLLTFSGYW